MTARSSIVGLPLWLSWERIRLQCGRPGFDPWVEETPWRRDRLPTPVFLGFPCGSASKESAYNAMTLFLTLTLRDSSFNHQLGLALV